jgi:hypothetical protein
MPETSMPQPFTFMTQYFWVLCLAFGAINYVRVRRALPAEHGSEVRGYLNKFAIGVNLPWLVMGVGHLTGYTPNVWYYFRPQDGNPFVIAWLATVFAASYCYAWWVLFAGGAEKVRDLNLSLMLGHYSGKRQPLWTIKLFAVIGVAMFPVWVYVAMSMDAPLPKF